MNLQQLRALEAVVHCGLSISGAAELLFSSQPAVSKQIRLLEEDLGAPLFIRQGKRLVGLTAAGEEALIIARRMLGDLHNLHSLRDEIADAEGGKLALATTHTQARYKLPPVILAFRELYPRVQLELHQGNPLQVTQMLRDGQVDVAIATEVLGDAPDLVLLPCYQWQHCIITPRGHPLMQLPSLSLEELSKWPLVTYDASFTGGGILAQAFARRSLQPNIVLTALDSDVIKTYVEMGLGVGLIARMAWEEGRDKNLAMREAGAILPSSTTRLGLRRGTRLRAYTYRFIELFASSLSRKVVERAMVGGGSDVGL